MGAVYIVEKTFESGDLGGRELEKGEYEGCIFKACDFSNGDLGGIEFLECEFIGCNWSSAKLEMTALKDVKFKGCKMLGLRFDTCEKFGLAFSFDDCQLNYSTFYQVKLKKTLFKGTHLLEVDFTDSDLSSCIFDHCDLAGAKFENTILEKADLRTSFHYSIDPEINRIKKAKFSLPGVVGLLDKYDIGIEGR